MTKRCLALTYAPKIEGVRNGTIRQTIREGYNYTAKDQVMFHGWEDRPYRSPWSWRTPYYTLTEVIHIAIGNSGLWFYPPKEIEGKFVPWHDLSVLASADGIVPPSGEALGKVLKGSQKFAPGQRIHAQILRWAPTCQQCGSEMHLSPVRAPRVDQCGILHMRYAARWECPGCMAVFKGGED